MDKLSGSMATRFLPSFGSLVRLGHSIFNALKVDMMYGWQVRAFEIPGSTVLYPLPPAPRSRFSLDPALTVLETPGVSYIISSTPPPRKNQDFSLIRP